MSKNTNTQELELTINPVWQNHPFVIQGPAEAVQPMADRIQARDARVLARAKAIEAVQRPVNAITDKLGSIASNVATDARVSLYDKVHGTRVGTQIKADREYDAQVTKVRNTFDFMRKVGAATVEPCRQHKNDSMACAKYREALARVAGLAG